MGIRRSTATFVLASGIAGFGEQAPVPAEKRGPAQTPAAPALRKAKVRALTPTQAVNDLLRRSLPQGPRTRLARAIENGRGVLAILYNPDVADDDLYTAYEGSPGKALQRLLGAEVSAQCGGFVVEVAGQRVFSAPAARPGGPTAPSEPVAPAAQTAPPGVAGCAPDAPAQYRGRGFREIHAK